MGSTILAHDVEISLFWMSILYLTLSQFCATDIGQGRKSYTQDLWWWQNFPHRIFFFFQCPHNLFCCCGSRRWRYIYISTSYEIVKSIFVKIRQNHRNENLNKSLCPVDVKLDTFVDLCGRYIQEFKNQNLVLKLQIKARNVRIVVGLISFQKRKKKHSLKNCP